VEVAVLAKRKHGLYSIYDQASSNLRKPCKVAAGTIERVRMPSGGSVQQKELMFVLYLGAALVVGVAVIRFAQMTSRQPVSGAGGNLLLVQSGDGRTAPGVVAAPAVDARQIDQRLLAASATTGGEVEVSLAWNGTSDFDLEVRDPSGELITAYHPNSASGGVQDVDANPTILNEGGSARAQSGQVPGAENVVELPDVFFDLDRQPGLPNGFTLPGAEGKAASRFTRAPVEHIYFARAPRGTYTVYAHCYSWRERSSAPLPYTVQVRSHGQVFHEVSGTLGPTSYVADGTAPAQACQFAIR
jgi:hypothetical protein